MEPTAEELEEALVKADEFFSFIISLLPEEIKASLT
jgi:hypothetical protein